MNGGSKIPDHWIARLFAKMLAIWGDGFTRKFAGVDLDDLKATWAQGLNGQNEASLKRGFAALFHEKYPPDLPRFIELCHIAPEHIASAYLAITHEHRVTEAGEANLANVRAILAKHGLPKTCVPDGQTGIEWAFRIVREADTNERIPLHKLGFAREAIGRWCESHHCMPDDLDDFGGWRGGSRAACFVTREAEDAPLPVRVPSPHIYGEGEGELMRKTVQAIAREPGSDDE
jgi:hypothetical protein